MYRIVPVLPAMVVALGLVTPVQSAVVISADNVFVNPGFSEVQVDVWIRAASADVSLASFDFEFRVAPMAGSGSELRFLDPQQDLQLSDPGYIFAGGSVRRDGFFPVFAAGPVGEVNSSLGGTPDDTFIGGDISRDATDMFVPVTLTADLPRLLVRLELIPDFDAVTPNIGDQFFIDLIPGANTVFSGLEFEFEQGSVTVAESSVTVIPEPSSLVLWGLVAGIGLVCFRRWRRNEL